MKENIKQESLEWLFSKWWYYVIVLFITLGIIPLYPIGFFVGSLVGNFIIVGLVILFIRFIYLKRKSKV